MPRLLFTIVSLLRFTASCPTESSLLPLFLLQPSVEDIHLLSDSYKLWQFASAADRLVFLATNITNEDLGLLFLVDSYIPPASFLNAIEALSTDQKTRIIQLSVKGNTYETERIMEGILFTIPKDDQVYSRNFLQLLSTARCLFESFSHSSAKLLQKGIRRRRE